MGPDDGEPRRPYRHPQPGPRRQPRQGPGGVRGLAVHAPHERLPAALGDPRPRLPDLRGGVRRRVTHPPRPRRRRVDGLPPPRRARAVPVYGARPRPAVSAGDGAFVAWVLSCLLLAWHTAVDVARFVAMVLQLSRDPPRTVFTAVKGVEFRRKRFVSRSLSLDDVKHVKNALGCTINDVLVGVTSAALSRYRFRKLGDGDARTNSTWLRSLLAVNLRPTSGINKLSEMMESGTHDDLKWGNRLGYIMLPFEIIMHDDPLDYVRNARKTVDRKKHSLEAIVTHAVTEMVTKIFGIGVATALFHRMVSSTTVQFSNMIGPVEPIEIYGHPVAYIAPSVFGHPSALTIHWQSYTDKIKVILAVDDAQFPDSHQLVDDFAESLKIIRYAA